MDRIEAYAAPLRTIPVYVIFIIALVIIMIGMSYVLGQRHKQPSTDQPYESGILSTGTAHLRVNIQYYLVAVVFLIFDLESAFIFAWAVAFKRLGWAGFTEIVVFIGLLGAALLYLWRVGALDWRRSATRTRRDTH